MSRPLTVRLLVGAHWRVAAEIKLAQTLTNQNCLSCRAPITSILQGFTMERRKTNTKTSCFALLRDWMQKLNDPSQLTGTYWNFLEGVRRKLARATTINKESFKTGVCNRRSFKRQVFLISTEFQAPVADPGGSRPHAGPWARKLDCLFYHLHAITATIIRMLNSISALPLKDNADEKNIASMHLHG